MIVSWQVILFYSVSTLLGSVNADLISNNFNINIFFVYTQLNVKTILF